VGLAVCRSNLIREREIKNVDMQVASDLDLDKLMHKVFDVLQTLPVKTLLVTRRTDVREQIFMAAGLALASVGFFAAATTPSALAIDRIECSAEPSSFSSGLEHRAGEPQEADAPQPRPAPVNGQSAPKPPQVTYEDGELTIIAENSLLSDVLSALHAVMGAQIDLPASASGERIWVRLGPGPARKVVSDLLSNTELNYVIQGSDTDVDGIRSVSLTPYTKAGTVGGPGAPNGQAARANRRIPRPNGSAAEIPEQENSTPSEPPASSDTAASGSPATGASPQSASADTQSGPVNPDSNGSKPVVRTAEQMMQQLQSLYEQRKQMQMQENQIRNQKPPAPSE
jgi:hypothetical protein